MGLPSIFADITRADIAIRIWIESDCKTVLAPKYKAVWLGRLAEEATPEILSAEMDFLANCPMPETMQ